MNDSQRNTLQRYRRRLADDLILTEDFLAQLIEEGIFEWGMLNVIKAEKTESEQIYKMLELLPKRGPLAFDRFVSVLERDYPWLATLLLSSSKSTPALRDASVNNNHQHHHAARDSVRPEFVAVEMSRSTGTPGTTGEGSDGDIKKLVASFVHRQFGQSKRISEKDKKAVERFVADQLQRERTRYQNMLPPTQHFTSSSSCPSSMSEGDEEVFDAVEIQEHLFKIHMKIEPHLNDPDLRSSTTTTAITTTTTSNSSNSSSSSNIIINSNNGVRERILPDDLSFEIIHKEMDLLCKKVHRLEEQVRQSMKHFTPEVQQTPLPELVSKMHEVLKKQHRELEETGDHNRRLLDEVERYCDHIDKLEKERREYRAQVNVLHQDMAKLRQDKMALQDRYNDLERSHKERLEKESTLDNLRLIVKDLRSHNGLTPRHNGLTTPRTEEGVGGRSGQGRRSMRASQMKQGVSYPLYGRRYTTNTRTVVKKGKGNLSSSNK
ncbi:uncharacterized protein LOC143277103 [Babylonia areolata]|uniref:uncharacterized protein LOC143277103 n=1 Tax=Babylonia areolata TaxID=304850 RepID=UPI003FD062A5